MADEDNSNSKTKKTTYSRKNGMGGKPTEGHGVVTLRMHKNALENFLKLTEALGANNTDDALERVIDCGKYVLEHLRKGKEILVVDLDNGAEILEKKSEDKVMVLGSKENLVFVGDFIKDKYEFSEEIKQTNNWYLPTEPWEA